MFYKVVTSDLKSLGLRRNPTILIYPINHWVEDFHKEYNNRDDGGIWVVNSLGNARKIVKYMREKSVMCRIFECQIGEILYGNSYRVKTNKVKLTKEIHL